MNLIKNFNKIKLNNDKTYKNFIKNDCKLIKDVFIKTFSKYENIEYTLRIRINKKIINNKSFLYIWVDCYNKPLINKEDIIEQPFILIDFKMEKTFFSKITSENDMIWTFLHYLLKTDDELQIFTGNKTIVGYRSKIIASLNLF